MFDMPLLYRKWLYPAYFDCLVLGITIMVVMIIVSYFKKTEVDEMISKLTSLLKEYKALGIIVMGVLWAIPLGIVGSVAQWIIWLLAAVPGLIVMAFFPFLLIIRVFRERVLMSNLMFKSILIVSCSAILASLIFILFTQLNLFSGLDEFYKLRNEETMSFSICTHPYSSIAEIWEPSILLMCEIIISLFLYFLSWITYKLVKIHEDKVKFVS